MPREIDIRFLELRMRAGQVGGSLAGAGDERGNVLRPLGFPFRIPPEPLHVSLVLRQLDHRIGVVLGVVKVIDLVQVPLVEEGIEHLGLHLVHGCQGVVLREEEQGGGPAQGVETPERPGAVEIGHHLGALDLVVTERILLGGDEGVGHEPRPVRLPVLDDDIDAVRRILPVPFVEDKRIPIQPDQGIQIIISQ